MIKINKELLYKRISQQEAKNIMDSEKDCIILDVRTENEFKNGHIPNAINIPNEEIGDFEIDALPDEDKKILVYCRSGQRSLQAAAKLGVLGYTNILEFGGILSWPYEIVK